VSGPQSISASKFSGMQIGDACADAGAAMLLRTGADQARAVPAPSRLRSRLREIRSSSSMASRDRRTPHLLAPGAGQEVGEEEQAD
jgi:hypothetical protein